jgi:hypothetical protein
MRFRLVLKLHIFPQRGVERVQEWLGGQAAHISTGEIDFVLCIGRIGDGR